MSMGTRQPRAALSTHGGKSRDSLPEERAVLRRLETCHSARNRPKIDRYPVIAKPPDRARILRYALSKPTPPDGTSQADNHSRIPGRSQSRMLLAVTSSTALRGCRLAERIHFRPAELRASPTKSAERMVQHRTSSVLVRRKYWRMKKVRRTGGQLMLVSNAQSDLRSRQAEARDWSGG